MSLPEKRWKSDSIYKNNSYNIFESAVLQLMDIYTLFTFRDLSNNEIEDFSDDNLDFYFVTQMYVSNVHEIFINWNTNLLKWCYSLHYNHKRKFSEPKSNCFCLPTNVYFKKNVGRHYYTLYL